MKIMLKARAEIFLTVFSINRDRLFTHTREYLVYREEYDAHMYRDQR